MQTTPPRNIGRVLSAANEQKLREARDRLDAVLSQLDSEESAAMNRAPVALKPGTIRVALKQDDDRTAEVFIIGDIGGWYGGVASADFARDLAALDVDTIDVRLNSPGGVIWDGLAIYGALLRHPANININVTGVAASVASVIAMAGDQIIIDEGSRMMIHKPWSGVIGDADAMRKEAEVLDGLESDIIDLYEARTGKDRSEIEKLVQEETWFSARQAVENGFADSVNPAKTKQARAARSAMYASFRNTPKDLLEHGIMPAVRELETLLREGEGFSHAQAKRIAALAARAIQAPRDDEPSRDPRDEGEVRKLIALLKSM